MWIDLQSLVDEELKSKARRPFQVFVSDIGNCLRKAYYSYFNPKEAPIELLKTFTVGDLIHEKVSEILSKKYEVKSERDVILFFPGIGRIAGRYDDLVIKGEEKVLIEKKSTSRIDLVEEPRFHDLIQIHLYMAALGVKKGQLVYFNKNNFKLKDFRIEFNQKIFDIALKRVKRLFECIKRRKPPEPEARKRPGWSWQCKFCPYRKQCEGEA